MNLLEIKIEAKPHQAMLDDPQGEVLRALEKVTSSIKEGRDDGVLYDSNGNRIGEWYFDPTILEDE